MARVAQAHPLDELREQLERVVPSAARWCPHEPHPKQRTFLELTETEALYGGAAGGGKSDALLMSALAHVDEPGYSAILFRRTYTDLSLPGALMDRAHEWLHDTAADWSATDKKWTFPSGATLAFGYLEGPRDHYRYQSAEFQFVGFDELTQFEERQYVYLFSRLRRLLGSTVPLQMRSATNPGGIGHEWVKARFLIEPAGRGFVPATLDDNPSLDRDEYRSMLARLDPVTRRQLEHGEWVTDESVMISPYDARRNSYQELPFEGGFRVLSVDLGYVDACAFVLAVSKHGDPYWWAEKAWNRQGLTVASIAGHIEQVRREQKVDRIVADAGALGKTIVEDLCVTYLLPIEAAEKKEKTASIHAMRAGILNGTVRLSRDCQPLRDEWAVLPWNDKRLDHHAAFADDCSDAALYNLRAHGLSDRASFDAKPPDMDKFLEQKLLRRHQQESRRNGALGLPSGAAALLRGRFG